MPGGNKKGHTYLNKPAAETCSRFIHSSDCSATTSLVCISSIPAAFSINCFPSYLHLVSSGLCSSINVLIFRIAVYFEWIQILNWSACDFVAGNLRSCMASSLPLNNSSTISQFQFPSFLSLPFIKTYLPHLSSSLLYYS